MLTYLKKNLQLKEADKIEQLFQKTEKTISFPFGSTQSRRIELAICSINWLLKSRGYQGLPLDLYTKYLDRYFHGSYIPKNLCKNLNDDIDYLTC